VSVFRGCFQDVVGEFSWWMSKMMMNEFGVYLSSLAEQRGFRLSRFGRAGRTETLADDLTCDRLASSSHQHFHLLLHHQLHKHG
jgi:hypothetical protein